MKHILAAATLSALATDALALSCMAPSVAQSYAWADAADEAYVVLYGGFMFGTPPSNDTGDINAPLVVDVDASFVGHALTRDGFQPINPLDLTVRLDCAGPWCGALPDDSGVMLAFVEQSDDGLLLTLGPCGGSLFSRVSREDFNTVEACMKQGACPGG